MIWYDLEIKILDKRVNAYKNECNMSDSNAGFDLYTSEDTKIEKFGFIPFGIVARLIKVEPMPKSNGYLKTDSHFWLMPRSSIYKPGLIMANSVGVIDKSYRDELKAPVWSVLGNSEIQKDNRLFQIVAPNMGWIRNVYFVDSMPETDRNGGFGSTGLGSLNK